MDGVSKLLQAIATLLWPVIVVVIICVFRPAVASLIESAKSRKFTLKIGGQELTMEEANQQQQKLIADLQKQVIEINKRLGISRAEEQMALPSAQATGITRGQQLLWVDDNPKNNSYIIQQLQNQDIRVDSALSTKDGVAFFSSKHYDWVISDMGREEDGVFNPQAGLELLRKIREQDKTVPFIFYTSYSGSKQEELRNIAQSLGATGITSSVTELLALLGMDKHVWS